MRLLITGHSGFIGKYLSPLLSIGHEIHPLQSNLLDHQAIRQEIKAVDPQLVIHLAARTEVQDSFYNPLSFTEVNYNGTVNLAECCATECTDLKLFAFASTMEVYGWQPISDEIKQNGVPLESVVFDENTEPKPNAPYAVAKRACELYLQYMQRSIGFPFVALRQTNSYGRHDNDFFVTEQIITQMLRKQSVINLGNPEPFRNFLHIDDLIAAWLAVIKDPLVVRGKIYTLGPNDPIRIDQYAKKIASLIGWDGQINWHSKPKRVGEIFWLNSDHKLITSDTGWQPTIDLEQGLIKTIDLWRDRC